MRGSLIRGCCWHSQENIFISQTGQLCSALRLMDEYGDGDEHGGGAE